MSVCRATRRGSDRQMGQDKARGYVIGESFFRHGISSIVYPVYDRSGRVAAVVSILVPSEIPQSDRERLQRGSPCGG